MRDSTQRHVDSRDHGGSRSAALARLLEHCETVFRRDLPPMLEQTMHRIDDALYDLADKADNSNTYAYCFEALRLVRRERAGLKRRFLHNLSETLASFESAMELSAESVDESSVIIDSDTLELVEDEEFEESLVLSNLISKAESRYKRSLDELARHFAALLGRRSLEAEDLPIGPKAICNAFGSALHGVPDLERATILLIYKVFDKQVLDNLDASYRDCVGVALSQGLEPGAERLRIVNPFPPSSPSDRSGQRRVQEGPAGGAGAAASEADSPERRVRSGRVQTSRPEAAVIASGPAGGTGQRISPARTAAAQPTEFSQLRVLLRRHRGHPSAPPNAVIVETPELTAELSRLQGRVPPGADVSLSPKDLRDSLIRELRVSDDAASGTGEASDRRLKDTDEDTMDLVFLLFEQLLAAPDIPDPIKVLISRLQIPFVKLAILDRSFFADSEHPARRLLNGIAAASLGWNDEGSSDGDDDLYGRIREVVERVVTEFRSDPTLFRTLEAEFSRFVAEDLREAQINELKTLRDRTQRGEREAARRKVSRVIDARLHAQPDIPPVVAAIALEGWAEVMTDAYAHEGENSDSWRRALRTLDRLIWSVQPKTDPAERRELLRRIPKLLRDLRQGISGTISDPQILGRWLRELQLVHIAVLRGLSGAASGTEVSPTGAPADRSGAGVRGATDESCSALDGLLVGTWLAVRRDDDHWLRAKLAWRSEDGEELVFVDRFGRRGFELTRPDLAALFRQDLVEIIGDGRTPIVDRAVEAVRQSLSLR